MAKTIDMNIGASLTKFTFSDADGDVFASFKMNVADARIIGKCHEIAEFFKDQSNHPPAASAGEAMAQLDKLVEDKFCYLLGYDCRQSLFGFMSPTTILADGEMFAVKVLERISEVVGAELKKRGEARAKAVSKHTAKYN